MYAFNFIQAAPPRFQLTAKINMFFRFTTNKTTMLIKIVIPLMIAIIIHIDIELELLLY